MINDDERQALRDELWRDANRPVNHEESPEVTAATWEKIKAAYGPPEITVKFAGPCPDITPLLAALGTSPEQLAEWREQLQGHGDVDKQPRRVTHDEMLAETRALTRGETPCDPRDVPRFERDGDHYWRITSPAPHPAPPPGRLARLRRWLSR